MSLSNPVFDHFRCPKPVTDYSVDPAARTKPGYFRFGPGTTCYGFTPVPMPTSAGDTADLPDLYDRVRFTPPAMTLPFEPAEIIDNLRLERYSSSNQTAVRGLLARDSVRRAYYYLRPAMSDGFRRSLQRRYLGDWESRSFPQWPVDCTVERVINRLLLLSMKARGLKRVPFVWFWPQGATAAAMVTHDVETEAGLKRVNDLIEVDSEFGITGAFQLVPRGRYTTTSGIVDMIRRRGFEANIHGLDHDGDLFGDHGRFLRESREINHYGREFQATGFRSPCMYRRPEWFHHLDFAYDMSIPNNACLEPQRGGCCTVFPYFIGDVLELPLTTTQDYSLFHVLQQHSLETWRKQLALILNQHGLMSFIIHPDYVFEERALKVYRELLAQLRHLASERSLWIARPGQINSWWRDRSQMSITECDGRLVIEGPGSERARLAYAVIENGELTFTLTPGRSVSLADDPDNLSCQIDVRVSRTSGAN